jgi:hypothetical protein
MNGHRVESQSWLWILDMFWVLGFGPVVDKRKKQCMREFPRMDKFGSVNYMYR